tara:strand:+ start:2585 stop:4042 length:1458 start_codon:yes stop_codon:yes gene_type:complete
MITKKKIIISLLSLLVLYFIFNVFIIDNKNIFGELKSLIPKDQKAVIKKYVFPYKYNEHLEKMLKLKDAEIEGKNVFVKDLQSQINKKDKFLSEVLVNKGFGNFYEVKRNIISLNDNEYILKEFNEDYNEIKKHGDARSGTIYAQNVNDSIILLSANGIFQYFKITDLKEKEFNSKIIKSNIKDIIKYEDFFNNSNYGVKDLFFYDGFLYFSFNRKVKDNCFNTSILRASLDYENLVFDKFFFPEKCQLSTNEWFTPHSAGGRMVGYKGKIIFSNGEYLNRALAQDDKSIFGKILILDPLNPEKFEILSKGHRNVQGLYVDEEKQVILSTEHGPMGGDEVNLNNVIGKKVLNFGWPISSYGEHYGYSERIDSHKIYKVAPLNKSHSKYGFEEPIKYFVPSIGISEIVSLEKNNKKNSFLFGALGKDSSEGDMSLHVILLDKNYKKLIAHEVVNIENRIRDIIDLNNGNFLLTLETNSTLGFLKKL